MQNVMNMAGLFKHVCNLRLFYTLTWAEESAEHPCPMLERQCPKAVNDAWVVKSGRI